MKNPFHYFIIVSKPTEYYDIEGGMLLKIEADGEEKISVTLTENDMKDLDITYEDMDYSNIETRRVIWTILDEAKRVLGKNINIDNRLLVQVSPAECGGCVIRFTQSDNKSSFSGRRLIMKKDCEPILFRAFDTDAFIDCKKTLDEMKSYSQSIELFRCDGEYYAVIKPQVSSTDKMLMRLCEYGDAAISQRKEICRVYERGISL